jgi:hypothetical protein
LTHPTSLARRGGAGLARLLKTADCFEAGTQVVVGFDDQGQPLTRNIEDIRVGDLVLAKDQDDESDDAQLRAVTAVSVRTCDHVRVLVIQDSQGNVETLRTTDEHPFFITNLTTPALEAGETSGASGAGGWVTADQLRAGDTLSGLDGEIGFTVLSSTREERPQGILVYNLTVEGDHTYFVADSEGQAHAVWAHNAKWCPKKAAQELFNRARRKVPTPTVKGIGKVADAVPTHVPKNWSKQI